MTENEEVNMDDINPVKPTVEGQPPEHPPAIPTIEPLNEEEQPKVRSTLRLYALMISLYVNDFHSPDIL